MRIAGLIWDEWNVGHIAVHGVESDEVEDVCLSRKRLVLRIGLSRQGLERYQVFGQTEEGRLLVIILDRMQPGQFYVATARDMTVHEKKGYRRKRK